jgi:hypothetical protein
MTSPFDFPSPILYRRSVKIFRLSSFKSYSSVLIWLEIWNSGWTIWDLWGFCHRNAFSYQGDLKNALPFSKPRRLSHCARKSVKPSGLQGHEKKHKGQVMVRKVFDVVFPPSVGPPPANRFKQFLAHHVVLPTLIIIQNFILIRWGVSTWQVRTDNLCFHWKAWSPLTQCLALPRLQVIKI